MNITSMTQNRKRCRNVHDEDASDFMPLSKRINNLHINNVFQVIPNSSEPANMFLKPTEWGPGPPICYTDSQESYNNPKSPEDAQSPSWNAEKPQYNPELNETQNPYYYNNNKLLFDLFVERMQRNGHSFN